MKCLVDRNSLLKILNISLFNIDKKALDNISSSFGLQFNTNTLNVVSSTLEIYSLYTINITNKDTTESKMILVKADLLTGIIEKCINEYIQLTIENNTLKVSDLNDEFNVNINHEQFPIKSLDYIGCVYNNMSSNILSNVIKNGLLPLEDNSIFRIFYNDNKLYFLNSDQARMAISSIDYIAPLEDFNIFLSLKGLKMLLKVISFFDVFNIYINTRELIIENNGNFFIIKLTEQSNLNYRNILASRGNFSINIEPKMLRNALTKALLVTGQFTKVLHLEFTENKLLIKSADSNFGSSIININLNSNFTGTIFINGVYLKDALSSDKECKLLYASNTKPLFIEYANVTHIIMPTRLFNSSL